MIGAEYIDIALRMLVATSLGMIVGFERQMHDQVAGIRTASLVSLGACGFVLFSMYVSGVVDYSRIAAQVVSGVGFLGAGAIMHDGLSVRGLTTAATMWCTAALGVLSAAGEYAIAVMLAAGILLVNTAIRPLSKRFSRTPETGDFKYAVKLACAPQAEAQVRKTMADIAKGLGFTLVGIGSVVKDGDKIINAEIATYSKKSSAEDYAQKLLGMDGVKSVSWHQGTMKMRLGVFRKN